MFHVKHYERETMKTTDQAVTSLSHRVAVHSKFLPVTNHRGARIKVTRGDVPNGTSVIVSWDYALDVAENHQKAIQEFLNKMEWGGHWVIGGGTNGYTAVRMGE